MHSKTKLKQCNKKIERKCILWQWAAVILVINSLKNDCGKVCHLLGLRQKNTY